MMVKNNVVQFNENHKWCGCYGFVEEVSEEKIMVGVPVPEKGTAYIFAKESELEVIGNSVLCVQE